MNFYFLLKKYIDIYMSFMFQRFFLFFVFCRRSNQTLLSCYSIFINNNFCIILCCLFLDSLHSFLRIFTHKKIEEEEAWQAAAQVIMMNASILKNTMMVSLLIEWLKGLEKELVTKTRELVFWQAKSWRILYVVISWQVVREESVCGTRMAINL